MVDVDVDDVGGEVLPEELDAAAEVGALDGLGGETLGVLDGGTLGVADGAVGVLAGVVTLDEVVTLGVVTGVVVGVDVVDTFGANVVAVAAPVTGLVGAAALGTCWLAGGALATSAGVVFAELAVEPAMTAGAASPPADTSPATMPATSEPLAGTLVAEAKTA